MAKTVPPGPRNGSSSGVGASVGEEACDRFDRSAQQQVLAEGHQNAIAREERWPATRLVDPLVAWRPQARQARTTCPALIAQSRVRSEDEQ